VSVLALIPARAGSKGIPGKNFKPLAGLSPVQRVYECALSVDCDPIVFSTDSEVVAIDGVSLPRFQVVWRSPELAQDDTPMIAVVKHVLEQIPGPDDQIIVLLQPTQPLRRPEHVRSAIDLLRTSQSEDSYVSVVQLPLTHHPEWQYVIDRTGRLTSWRKRSMTATRRQDLAPTYIRDGTVYAFWRRTVTRYGNIYGKRVGFLGIPRTDTCPLDTPEDWAEAERRLRQ
jgi:CMP-N,N'-diacetyllegionaminic acid synthase